MREDLVFWVLFTFFLTIFMLAVYTPRDTKRRRRDVVRVMMDTAPDYELVNAFEVDYKPAADLCKKQGYLPVILLVKNRTSGFYHAARLPENHRPVSHCIYRRVHDLETFSLQPYSKTFPYFSNTLNVTKKKQIP